MRRPHGGAVCHSLPTVTHASPFKLGEGPAGPRRASGRWGGLERGCAVCARGQPPMACGEPWCRGRKVLGL